MWQANPAEKVSQQLKLLIAPLQDAINKNEVARAKNLHQLILLHADYNKADVAMLDEFFNAVVKMPLGMLCSLIWIRRELLKC